MADDRYRLPPSPCSSCFHGPSGRCQRPYGLERNSGGCRIWTEWFMDFLAESLPGNPTAHGKRRRVMTRLIFREVVLGAIYFLLVTAIMAELIHFAI